MDTVFEAGIVFPPQARMNENLDLFRIPGIEGRIITPTLV